MQLCHMMSDTKYRLYFNETETENIRLTLGKNISIRNVALCYYIENVLPSYFEQCNGKRIMVTNIYDEDKYINATVLLQDIDLEFSKPKDKSYKFKITEVSFKDGKSFKNWLKGKNYAYKIIEITSGKVKVVLFNVSVQDELSISLSGGKINRVCSIIEYMILFTADKVKEQIVASI